MTPTIEEVKKVAINCGMREQYSGADTKTKFMWFTEVELQAFAQHYKEEGVKERDQFLFDGYAVFQELDEKAATRTSAENVSDVLDAVVRLIRNNTGE